MKKLLLLLGISIILLSFSACEITGDDADVANVRFQNAMTDGSYPYGMKLGDAEYKGVINTAVTTPYDTTDPGSYSVQLWNPASQTWFTDSLGTLTVEGSHSYTVVIAGTVDSYNYYLLQDD